MRHIVYEYHMSYTHFFVGCIFGTTCEVEFEHNYSHQIAA